MQLGRMIFYRAEDGFYLFDGENSLPIGVDAERNSRFDDWFLNNAQRDFFHRMTSAIDPRTKTARWAFASTASATGQPDKMLIYNWSAGRAAIADIAIEVLAPMLTPSLTLEDLDTLFASLDDIPVSLDDPIFAGGVPQLGAMSVNRKYANFGGDTLEATLETDDFAGRGLGVVEIQAAAPLIDADDVRAKVGSRYTYDGAMAYTGESSKNREGVIPLRGQGRFARLSLRVPAAQTWTKAEGFGYGAVQRGA